MVRRVRKQREAANGANPNGVQMVHLGRKLCPLLPTEVQAFVAHAYNILSTGLTLNRFNILL